MRTFDELVARLRSPEAGGFGITTTRGGELVLQAIRRLAVVSEWLTDEREIGPTVVDQFLYDLDDDVIDVKGLMIDGDPKYQRVSTTEAWDLAAGVIPIEARFSGSYSPRISAGNKKVGISPIPDTAGLSIVALVAIIPDDISGSEVPPFPDDAEDSISRFARAMAYEEVDEDFATADAVEAKALAYAGELHSRGTARVGSGLIQAGIWGTHF